MTQKQMAPRERIPTAEVFAEKETKKETTITQVTFKLGDKIYVAEFKKPAEAEDVKKKIPVGGSPKEVNKKFAEMAESYEPVIYEKKKDKKILVDDPTMQMVIKAGKAMTAQAIKKTIDIKGLVPKIAKG